MNNHLRALRNDHGWSQADLAEKLEVSRQTINAIETGKYDPSLPLAFKIARLFGLSIESIFEPQIWISTTPFWTSAATPSKSSI